MSDPAARKSRRQSGDPPLLENKDDLFPPTKRFLPLHKLPSKKAVICKIRHLSQEHSNLSLQNIYFEVAKLNVVLVLH